MADAIVNFSVVAKRMLTLSEAARRYGRPQKRFKIECPVEPVRFANGDVRYDVDDLDAWIDTLKMSGTSSADEILERLE